MRGTAAAKWYINYTSGSSVGAHPIDVARGAPDSEGVNEYLMGYLFSMQPNTFLGAVVMDFPEIPASTQLIDELIAMNLPD